MIDQFDYNLRLATPLRHYDTTNVDPASEIGT